MDVLWLHVDGCLQGAHTDNHTTDCQMLRSGDGRRENSPSSEPGQAQSPRNFQRKAQGTPHLTPLCTTKCGAAALPFASPALLNPLAHGAAHNSQSSKCQCFIFGQAQCRVHPCMHKRINRRLQSPQAQLQFPLQMYFCYKLWHAAVVCKNGVIQRSGFKFKDNVTFIWNISTSNALPDTLSVSLHPYLSCRQGGNIKRESRWDSF